MSRTVTRLRAVLAISKAELERREKLASELDGDEGRDISMDAIMYHKEVFCPLERLLEVAESAAKEAAAAERSKLLLGLSSAVLRCQAARSLAPLTGLLEALASSAPPPQNEEDRG